MKKTILLAALQFLLCLFSMTTTAQQLMLDWFSIFRGIGDHSHPISIAVDAEGNSYVAGTIYVPGVDPWFVDEIFTLVKYSPSGQQLWFVQMYETGTDSRASAVTVDNQGGVYVTGSGPGNFAGESDFITVRFDAATGEETWYRRYGGSADDVATAIAIDNAGGLYVSGYGVDNETGYYFATVRYDAATGEQTWASRYNAHIRNPARAIAIAIDNQDGVYVTGSAAGNYAGESDFFTVRYNALTGQQTWADENGGDAIAVDNAGGVYVTGNGTRRYEASTGKQTWEDGGSGGNAIAIDNASGVYVTGYFDTHNATIRYDGATGEQAWAGGYGGGAITVDNAGGVYITGGRVESFLATVRYDAATGEQTWQDLRGGGDPSAIAVDNQGHVFVANNSAGNFLTYKYSQQGQCPVLAEAEISGYRTVSSSFTNARYALSVPGATTFDWSITAPDGSANTAFTGQGTPAIIVDWPASPEVYKVRVSYSAGSSCPTTTSTKYVYVYDTKAGFVTGGGWSDSPANTDYELMQQEGKAYWAFGARYKESKSGGSAGDLVQGALLLVLGSGQAFRSTSVQEGSLVIAGNRAYFTGTGTLTRRGAGGLETDPRRFAYLLSATDGDREKPREEDRLRLLLWTLKVDGSQGEVVYDSQLSCPLPNLDENAEACQQIDNGSIVIHKGSIKSLSDLFATAAGNLEPAAQGLTAYPTAFTESTTISFSADHDTGYSLELYDLKGALVQRIAAGTAEAGQRYEHELQAQGLAKGLYLARLTTGTNVQTVKLVVER